ncbi:MAG: phosphoglyceromutase [Proteobacteria bacterium TMED261]|nr:MAG: phosphoglyceromutase [Proteobacteria bacterium TMED261]
MNNLILVRHGQSQWNKEKRFTGWADIDLTEKGKKEAKYAGQLIKKLNIEFDVCFTSKLKRAINTSEIILKVLNKNNIKVCKTSDLNERHYGELTGLNKDEIAKKFGIKQVLIWRRSLNIAPPPMKKNHPYKKKINSNILSESLKDTFNRVVPYYNENIKPLIISKKNILVIFHGNSCRALLMKIFNISKKKIDKFEIPTGNPMLVKFSEDGKILNYKYLDSKRSKKIIFNI